MIFRLLGAACACALLLTAPAGAAPKKDVKKSAKKAEAVKDAYAGVEKPANPEELLRNLKFALEHHLLLSDAFYEEKNLQRFFGNRRTHWFKLPRPFIRNGKLQGLEAVFQPGGNEATIDVLYKYVAEGNREKRRAMIGIDGGRDARAGVDMVIRVFGKEGRVLEPDPRDNPGPARPAAAAIHPMGNKLLAYEFDGPQSKGNLNIRINSDGSVGNIIAIEEQKAWVLAPLVVQPPQPAPAQ